MTAFISFQSQVAKKDRIWRWFLVTYLAILTIYYVSDSNPSAGDLAVNKIKSLFVDNKQIKLLSNARSEVHDRKRDQWSAPQH